MASESRSNTTKTTPDFSRTIVDPEGRVWFVREMASVGYDRRGTSSLVFMTDEVMRRVRDYPESWRTMSDEELYLLSLHR